MPQPLRWVVKPQDPTENVLEIWWTGNPTLQFTLTPPGGTALGPLPAIATSATVPPQSFTVMSNAAAIGAIDFQSYAASGSHMLRVTLNPTLGGGSSTTPPDPGTGGSSPTAPPPCPRR